MNPQLLGDLFASPAVKLHERCKCLGFLDGLEILTQTVLDKLFLENFRMGQLLLIEVAVNLGQASLLSRSPASFAGNDNPLLQLVRPAHADGAELALLTDAQCQSVQGIFVKFDAWLFGIGNNLAGAIRLSGSCCVTSLRTAPMSPL